MDRRTSGPLFIGLIFTGMLAGGLFGAVTGREFAIIHMIAALFMKALRMMVIPLVTARIITGIASLGDVRRLRKLGLVTIIYYLSTTFLSVVTGLVLVNMINPGAMAALGQSVQSSNPDYSIMEVFIGMLPSNIFHSMAEGDVLPIIVVSIIFGAALTTIGKKGRPVLDLFEGLFIVSMRIVGVIIAFAPIGVFALVAERIGRAGGWTAFSQELGSLGLYMLTVILGLAVHAFIVLPGILFFIGRRRPFMVFNRMAEALTMAFSTASSSATLPVTLNCLDKVPGVKRSVSGFVLPLGATVNMDGTALYEAVAAVFIAQAYGIELTLVQQIVVALTATMAAIGAAGIPEAGLVTMVLVLESVGLPLEGIGLILAVDWFLDRCRTTVNVWGDGVGAVTLSTFVTDVPSGAISSAPDGAPA